MGSDQKSTPIRSLPSRDSSSAYRVPGTFWVCAQTGIVFKAKMDSHGYVMCRACDHSHWNPEAVNLG